MLEIVGGLFTIDTNAKLLAAVVATLIGAGINWLYKKRRLRAAIRIEIEATTEEFRKTFHTTNLTTLETLIRSDSTYIVTIFTSDRHVVIGNLTDDISFIKASVAERILTFNSIAELVDDAIHFMRTHEFCALPVDRKLRILHGVAAKQAEIETLSAQILEEL